MTSKRVKELILNYDMTDKLLDEYLEIDFRGTIIGMLNSFYEVLSKCNENKKMLDEIILQLESITLNLTDTDKLQIVHNEIKILISKLYQTYKIDFNSTLYGLISDLRGINRNIKQFIINKENIKKLIIIEKIINENKSLKTITALIRDNKGILKIRDENSENILYKLLNKYSYLDEFNEDEICYLYQVISLFINNEDLNIEIIKDIDYYLSALDNKELEHVQNLILELENKQEPISIEKLENRFRVNLKHPSTIERELEYLNITEEGCRDFTMEPHFTIDGEGSICLDDALYWKRNRDGSYYLIEDITYIPAIIPYDFLINKVSIEMMETKYLIDGAYSLYPDIISNDLASLLPGSIKYVETGIWLIEPNMTVVEDSFKICRSIIKNHHRLTYEEADKIIASRSDDLLCRNLTDLGRFALRQRERNKTKEEYRKQEDSNVPIHESRLVDVSVSANIVQECSLLWGKSKGEYYKKHQRPYIYRACGMQYNLSLNGELLRDYNLNNRERLILMPAYYTATPERHCGLGYNVYSHSSSPARRSPDGQNQYIDQALIFTPNPSDKTIYFWEEETKRLAKHYNETSNRIDAFSNNYNYLKSKKLIK